MGIFDGFKSYEHEINEVRTYLLQERNMRKEYADPFIAAYGKKLGKLIEDGRKKSLQLNTTSSMGAQLNKEFSQNDVRFSVLGQAIRGYFSDLRSGKYVNTAVETAIWGIILDEDPQLVNSMKPRLWEFVVNNYGRMAPSADIVFRSEDDSFTGMVSSKSSGPARPVPTRPVATRASTSNAPKRGLDKKHRVFAALIKMLGNSKASGVLNRLWTNENFRRSLGYKNVPGNDVLRVRLALEWLTNELDNPRAEPGITKKMRSANELFFAKLSGVGGYVMTDSQVKDLIQDVQSFMRGGDVYTSGPAGKYLDGLEDYCIDKE